MTDVELLKPKLNVAIEGSPLSIENSDQLIAVTVLEDLEAPSMFTIEIFDWDEQTNQMTWVDSEKFNIGNRVKIQMGYENKLETLMVGEITGIEIDVSQNAVPNLTVRGYDLRHRLLRGQKTCSYTQLKDSEIVKKIASKQGLKAEVSDTKVKLEYVLQANQTDMEFLQTRANRLGYEVVVEEDTLLFRPHQNNLSKILTLNPQKDLIDFSSQMTTMNQVEKIEVRYWDIKQKEALVTTAKVGDENPKMDGANSGPQTVKKAFGSTSNVIFAEAVTNKSESDEIAKGRFKDMALAYISGEGSCVGMSNLRAGKIVEIIKLGKRFSGLYYVTSTNLKFSLETGYQTSFTVRRNAA